MSVKGQLMFEQISAQDYLSRSTGCSTYGNHAQQEQNHNREACCSCRGPGSFPEYIHEREDVWIVDGFFHARHAVQICDQESKSGRYIDLPVSACAPRKLTGVLTRKLHIMALGTVLDDS